jgi:hypothetical protein
LHSGAAAQHWQAYRIGSRWQTATLCPTAGGRGCNSGQAVLPARRQART